MAYSGSQTTRIGGYGMPRALYGSFAGKTAETIVLPNSMVDNLLNPIKDAIKIDSMTNPWWEDFP